VMQSLFWTTIQEAKNNGLVEFDLGRSEWGNEGLIAFKDRWGAARSTVVYLRSPAPRHPGGFPLAMRLAKPLFAVAPDRLLTAAGELLYRHIG